MSGVLIRAMTATDWTAVESIYREGIATGNATFEAEPPTWTAFDSGKLALGRLIAADAAGVVAFWRRRRSWNAPVAPTTSAVVR